MNPIYYIDPNDIRDIYYYGPIKPVEATDEMTVDVGQKGGKLYTAPGRTFPEATEGEVLTVTAGEWDDTNSVKTTLAALAVRILAASTRKAQYKTRIKTLQEMI